MRHFKALVLTVFAILLTGCYTQLQYSKTAQKTADEQDKNESGYSWTDEDNNGKTADVYKQQRAKAKQLLENEYAIAYKDYEYAQNWEKCGCNPYKVYNFYGSSFDSYGYDYYPYASHRSYLTISPYYNPWGFHHSFYGQRHYYGSRFSIGFSWGNPYHSYFYDPFYSYGYGGFWGNHSYYVYNNFYGSGVYYDNSNRDVNKNTRYGRRSIGTDRVNVNRNRGNNNGTVRGRKATVSSGGTTVRTRSSVGTSRMRNRGTVRSRRNSGSNSQGTVRNRGDRENDNNRFSRNTRYRSISDSNLDDVGTQRQRSRTFRNVAVDTRKNDERRTFFNRLKGFFKRSAKSLTTGSGSNSTFGSSTRTGFGSSSTTTTRSRSTVGSSTSDRSSVGSSRSSSSNSRSRGSSSRSRSRSGGSDGGSSSSDRSRDN